MAGAVSKVEDHLTYKHETLPVQLQVPSKKGQNLKNSKSSLCWHVGSGKELK
jgi:hypothetical protein